MEIYIGIEKYGTYMEHIENIEMYGKISNQLKIYRNIKMLILFMVYGATVVFYS